jgi:hypothetical protein
MPVTMERHRQNIEFGAEQHPKLEEMTYTYGPRGIINK